MSMINKDGYVYLGGGVYARVYVGGIDLMPNHHGNTAEKIWADTSVLKALRDLIDEVLPRTGQGGES